MTSRDAIEATLRTPSTDERRYLPPGLRPSAVLGRPSDPAWRAADERSFRRRWLFATVVVVGLVSFAGLAMSGALTSERPAPASPSPSVAPTFDRGPAAEALGVAPSVVIPTADGVIAARRSGATVELAIARLTAGGWSVRVLASFVEPADFTGSASFEVVCDGSFGLSQPNFAYGDTHGDQATPLATIRVVGQPGTGTPYGNGPWAVAFQVDGPMRDQSYTLSADRGPQYRLEKFGQGSFHDPQACGTVEDLSRPSLPSATPAPPVGSGRLLLEPSRTTYSNETPGIGTPTPYPVRIFNARGILVFESGVTAEQPVDLKADTYRVAAAGGLNDCDATVSVESGKTTIVSIEWFAGGCRITVDASS